MEEDGTLQFNNTYLPPRFETFDLELQKFAEFSLPSLIMNAIHVLMMNAIEKIH